ncbi:MAG: glycine cleavage system aminomethyltransferase GcvT [Gammaproteobacteria bacterium]|nr:glycine cleavage system aminomethyltransferase GcvT [Gammaproteobacteria bacterium]MYF37335.1 glycine cleavage system aminomethyltransferase GcvT [Gammaproteobacteria bacterium]
MKTALYENHVNLNAQIVDFAGWQMPMRYSSTIDEHHAVRNHAGMFDVSHMLTVDFDGPDSLPFLQKVLASDVGKLATEGQALYTAMLNERGGIIDDLIVYRLNETCFRIVFNAGVADTDMEWVTAWQQSTALSVSITPRRDLSIIAVQGPKAIQTVIDLLDCPQLIKTQPFTSMFHNELFIGRTGYTGEDGVEIICPDTQTPKIWSQLYDADVIPCGLGARDTLRLEAGMNLNGQDMSPDHTPYECALTWVLDLTPSRDFVGQTALEEAHRQGVATKLTGIVLQGGVMRSGYEVQSNAGLGTITSGSFSPTLGYSVALARVPRAATGECSVLIRNKQRTGKIVRPPFVRHGEKAHK